MIKNDSKNVQKRVFIKKGVSKEWGQKESKNTVSRLLITAPCFGQKTDVPNVYKYIVDM